MKKKLLCVAVASAIAVPVAAGAHELYGDVRLSLNNVDAGSGNNFSEDNNASRLGVKGSYDFGNGTSALYHVEVGLNADTGTAGDVITRRFAFAGLKGGFGTALYGTLSSPYKMAGLKVDPFYDTSAGTGFAGANFGLSPYTNGWFDNVLAYITPTVGGVHANAVMVIDDGAGNDHSYNWGLTYDSGGFNASLQYLDVNPNVATATRLAVGYKTKDWSIGLSRENVDTTGAGDVDYTYLSGTYHLGKKTRLAAAYGDVDGSGSGVTLGVFHKLFKTTEIHALYSNVDFDAADDRRVFSVGVSHKFSIGGK